MPRRPVIAAHKKPDTSKPDEHCHNNDFIHLFFATGNEKSLDILPSYRLIRRNICRCASLTLSPSNPKPEGYHLSENFRERFQHHKPMDEDKKITLKYQEQKVTTLLLLKKKLTSCAIICRHFLTFFDLYALY